VLPAGGGGRSRRRPDTHGRVRGIFSAPPQRRLPSWNTVACALHRSVARRDGDRTPRRSADAGAPDPRPTATPGTRRGADSRERKIEPQLNLSSHSDVSDVAARFAMGRFVRVSA
jgi:hypothetical protein